MQITEVQVKPTDEFTPNGDRLVAFARVTLDNMLCLRELRIIRGENGLFVAMASRKITARCDGCGSKNHLRANYCSHCGAAQPHREANRDESGRSKLYVDIFHPICGEMRAMIEDAVIGEYLAGGGGRQPAPLKGRVASRVA